MGNCSLKLWRDSTSFPAEMWCLVCCPASWARCLLWVSCVCLTKKFLDFCLVSCGWVNPYLRRFRAAFGFLGDTGGMHRGKFRFSVSCWVQTGRVCWVVWGGSLSARVFTMWKDAKTALRGASKLWKHSPRMDESEVLEIEHCWVDCVELLEIHR